MEEIDFYKIMKPYMTKDQIDTFISSLNDETYNKGAILNSAKLDFNTLNSEFENKLKLKKNTNNFLLLSSDVSLSKSPFHYGGAYYLVDPSAYEVVDYLIKNLPQNAVVLDMCAAPGGKTIILALERRDVLVIANEVNKKRSIVLKGNIHRLGLSNVIVTNNEIEDFYQDRNLHSFFDAVITDVPCSGIGMLRKKEKMYDDYTFTKAMNLVDLQKDILTKSSLLVKNKGNIVYSTCSFNKEENEDVVESFLGSEVGSSFTEIKQEIDNSFVNKYGNYLVPPFCDGEGHYICLLEKSDNNSLNKDKDRNEIYPRTLSVSKTLSVRGFKFDNNYYYLDKYYSELDNLNIISYGVSVLSEFKDDKFDLNVFISHTDCDLTYEKVNVTDVEEGLKYLKGLEIEVEDDNSKDIKIVAYKNVNLGFGKKVNNKIKNYYPKGLRIK